MKPFEQATTQELRALWEEKYPQEPVNWWPNYGCPYVFVSASTRMVDEAIWENTEADMCRYYMGLVFHDSEDGKAVAKEVAKKGFIPHPGMDWQEDLRKLRDAMDLWDENRESDARFGVKVYEFLDKYLPQ